MEKIYDKEIWEKDRALVALKPRQLPRTAWYRIVKRVIGAGYQVRVRTFDGQEHTVMILSTLEDARKTWDRLNREMIPLTSKP